MFGNPVDKSEHDAIFHLVWTYHKCKKAHWICDGSTHSEKVLVLVETCANCVDRTSAHLFYMVSLAENMPIFGADFANAFIEAPTPKQPFFIRLDRVFCKWWTNHLKWDPILARQIILVLSANQGHLESPHLWEKHADKILHKISLTPTVHEPCLYSRQFGGIHDLFLQHVNNFAIAAPDARTSDIVMDLINDRLTIPIKWQG